MSRRWFEVKSGWLTDQGRRLDAAAYGEGGLAARDHIKAGPWPWCRLGELAAVYLPPRFARRYVRDSERGVSFLSSSDILLADLKGLTLLSRRATSDLQALMAVPASTLISRSGTVGRTAYWREEMRGMAVSEDVIHVRPSPSRVLPGYLFAFLTSAPAQAMIRQQTYGSVVQHIEPHHLVGLPVPLPEAQEQRRIHELVDNAARARTEARRLLDEASSYFDSLAGSRLTDYEHQFATGVVSARSLSRRLDAFYHVGWASDGQNDLGEPMGTFADVIGTSRVPRVYATQGVPFLSGIDIFRSRPPVRVKLARHIAEAFGAFVRVGELAVQGSGQRYGLLGRIAYIGRRLDGWAASHDLFRIRPNRHADAARVYAYARSETGRRAILRHSYGTSIPHVNVTGIANVKVPELPMQLRAKAALALELREQADADEELAIREVEAWLG